jgi:sphingolipid delta-4 desaturase
VSVDSSARGDIDLFKMKLHWGMFGSAAPIFPGFEVDISDRIPDESKPDAVWHRERARSILRAYPEVKDLFGICRCTAILCLAAAGAQLALAACAVHLPWWGILLIAYFIGPLINIQLFQLSHECDHGLVFKSTFLNRYLFTLTSIPMFLSAHHTWWVEHIVHHNDMGAKKDFISRRRTFFMATRKKPPLFVPFVFHMLIAQMLRSIAGLLVYVVTSLLRFRLQPTDTALKVLGDTHLVSAYKKQGIEKWAVIYPLLSFVIFGALMWYGYWVGVQEGLVGWALACSVASPIFYLFITSAFFTGFLHPYCLGWVLGISHFHGSKRYQPTASHYGKLTNLVSFNAGLHVEHHDIMGIPWVRLWKLRRIAAEFYDDLVPIKSYTALGLQFVFANAQSFDEHFANQKYRNLDMLSDADQATKEAAGVTTG